MPPAERKRRRPERWGQKARNAAWRIAALVVAYGIWLTVAEEQLLLGQLQVPIRYEQLDPGLALSGDRPASVEVQVQAPEAVIGDLRPVDVEARVDLAGFREGAHTIRLWRTGAAGEATDNVGAPLVSPRRLGVEVVNVFPRTITFEIEPRETKQIPVEPLLAGSPVPGFEVSGVTATPASVQIEGPRSVVATISAAFTRQISVDGMRQPFAEEVWIDVEGSADVILSDTSARIEVAITERLAERTFDNLAVSALRSEYRAAVDPQETSVKVRGPERLLSAMTAEDVTAYVDLHGLEPQPGPYQLAVQVTFAREQFRERVEVVDVSLQAVSVRLSAAAATDGVPAIRGG